MATTVPQIFVEIIPQPEPSQYQVTASSTSTDTTALEIVGLDYAASQELKSYRDLLSAGDVPDRHHVERIGSILWKCFFPAPIARVLWAALGGASKTERPLDLCLKLEDKDLRQLPWEALKQNEDLFAVGTPPDVSIVRIAVARPKPPAINEGPGRLLFVASEPQDCSPVEAEREWQAIQRAVAETPMHRVHPASLHQLREEVKQGVTAIHFVGHGEARDEGYLIFEGARGEGQSVSGTDLYNTLKRSRVPLVYLSACNSARSGVPGALSVAEAFARAGGGTAIAMQVPIDTEDAISLAESFYTCLFSSYSVEGSLAEARAKQYAKDVQTDRASWFAPVLYVPFQPRLLESVTGKDFRGVVEPSREQALDKVTTVYLDRLARQGATPPDGFDLSKVGRALRGLRPGKRAVVLSPWSDALAKARGISGALCSFLARQSPRSDIGPQERGRTAMIPIVLHLDDPQYDTSNIAASLAGIVKMDMADAVEQAELERWLNFLLREGRLLLIADGFKPGAPSPPAGLRLIQEAWTRFPETRIAFVMPEENWTRLREHILPCDAQGRSKSYRMLTGLARPSTVFDKYNERFWSSETMPGTEEEAWSAVGKLWVCNLLDISLGDFFAGGDLGYLDRAIEYEVEDLERITDPRQRRSQRGGGHTSKIDSVDSIALLLGRIQPSQAAVLVAEPGVGKTTELLATFHKLWANPSDGLAGSVPVYVDLKRYADLKRHGSSSEESIVRYLARELKLRADDRTSEDEFQKHVPWTKSLVFLLDSLDEAAGQDPEEACNILRRVLDELHEEFERKGDYKVVVGTRPLGRRLKAELDQRRDVLPCRLMKIRPQDGTAYLQRLARDPSLVDTVVQELGPDRDSVLSNPMMVLLLSTLMEHGWESDLEEAIEETMKMAGRLASRDGRPAELSLEMIYLAVVHRWLKRKLKKLRSSEEERLYYRFLLSVVAAAMVDKGTHELSDEEIAKAISDELWRRGWTDAESFPEWWPDDEARPGEGLPRGLLSGRLSKRSLSRIVKELLRAPVVLQPVRSGRHSGLVVTFQHQTMRDFFASSWLVNEICSGQRIPTVEERVLNLSWQGEGSWRGPLAMCARQLAHLASDEVEHLLQAIYLLMRQEKDGDSAEDGEADPVARWIDSRLASRAAGCCLEALTTPRAPEVVTSIAKEVLAQFLGSESRFEREKLWPSLDAAARFEKSRHYLRDALRDALDSDWPIKGRAAGLLFDLALVDTDTLRKMFDLGVFELERLGWTKESELKRKLSDEEIASLFAVALTFVAVEGDERLAEASAGVCALASAFPDFPLKILASKLLDSSVPLLTALGSAWLLKRPPREKLDPSEAQKMDEAVRQLLPALETWRKRLSASQELFIFPSFSERLAIAAIVSSASWWKLFNMFTDWSLLDDVSPWLLLALGRYATSPGAPLIMRLDRVGYLDLVSYCLDRLEEDAGLGPKARSLFLEQVSRGLEGHERRVFDRLNFVERQLFNRILQRVRDHGEAKQEGPPTSPHEIVSNATHWAREEAKKESSARWSPVSRTVRRAVERSLTLVDQACGATPAQVLDSLREEWPRLGAPERISACSLLGKLQSHGPAAGDLLVELGVNDSDSRVKAKALANLWRCSAGMRSTALSAFENAIRDPDWRVRRAGLIGLARFVGRLDRYHNRLYRNLERAFLDLEPRVARTATKIFGWNRWVHIDPSWPLFIALTPNHRTHLTLAVIPVKYFIDLLPFSAKTEWDP